MINRHYFIAAEKPHMDGKLSYSYWSLTFTHKTWIANPVLAYDKATKHIEELMSDKPGDKIQIIAFNRI